MTLQSTLLFQMKAIQRGWVSSEWLEACLTGLSAHGDPRGVPQAPPVRGSGPRPWFQLMEQPVRQLSSRDLRPLIAGCDLELLRRAVPEYCLVPLGTWGHFMELDGVMEQFLGELAVRIRGRGRPSCGIGFWLSYLPGSHGCTKMRIERHDGLGAFLRHVRGGVDTNVVQVLARFGPDGWSRTGDS